MKAVGFWRELSCSGGGSAGKEEVREGIRERGRDKTAASRGCLDREIVAQKQALSTSVSARHSPSRAGAHGSNPCCTKDLRASYPSADAGAGA